MAVGYSDGTTAFYDIKNSSPLLQYTENKVTVFYPYNDIREHNVCVTGLFSNILISYLNLYNFKDLNKKKFTNYYYYY